MPRISGEVIPHIPPTAPLSTRLSAEVYALDGAEDEGGSYTGPAAGPQGRRHVHPYKPCACQKQGLGLDLSRAETYRTILCPYCSAAGGKIRLTLQPRPPALGSPISTLAPWRVAISRTIASPRPLPVPVVPGTR